ncbi:hypothetical protein A4G18_05990 [Pasteurellaceae bacterium Pebbles2]|nr:hypothetical protein [Pasteurellaceae bacterium Pebbles2]
MVLAYQAPSKTVGDNGNIILISNVDGEQKKNFLLLYTEVVLIDFLLGNLIPRNRSVFRS